MVRSSTAIFRFYLYVKLSCMRPGIARRSLARFSQTTSRFVAYKRGTDRMRTFLTTPNTGCR